ILILSMHLVYGQNSTLDFMFGTNTMFLNANYSKGRPESLDISFGKKFPGLNLGFRYKYHLNQKVFLSSTVNAYLKIRDKWAFSNPTLRLEEELKFYTIAIDFGVNYKIFKSVILGVAPFYETILDKNQNLGPYFINTYNPHNYGLGFSLMYSLNRNYQLSLTYLNGFSSIVDSSKDSSEMYPYALKVSSLALSISVLLDRSRDMEKVCELTVK
ncbi:MAG TPA: hypothetical protein PLY55_01515, partial [Saprospiraceae bacterium]|nr:hypothetical protein [Saprospiraceae bacterium]